MKLVKNAMLVLTSIVSVAVAHAQTVDEIIAKHLEAVGGKEKLGQINSLYMENSIDIMGNEAPSTTVILNGKGFKNEIDFNGQKIVQCITDKGGWSINPMSGQTAATPMPEEQVKAVQDQIFIGGPLFNYAQKGSKVELVGKEDVNGVNALKLKVTNKNNVESVLFLDPDKYFILKAVNKQNIGGQEMETTASFSNYQKTDFGYVVPFTTEIQLPQGFTLKTNLKKVEVNKPVDENVFKAG